MSLQVNQTRHVILCVDDEANALTVRKIMLEEAGYEVLTAATAPSALRIFKEHEDIGLVLTDHLMAGGTGLVLAQVMKILRPSVPIAIYSGMLDGRGQGEHADAFIAKDIPATELLVEIARLLKL